MPLGVTTTSEITGRRLDYAILLCESHLQVGTPVQTMLYGHLLGGFKQQVGVVRQPTRRSHPILEIVLLLRRTPFTFEAFDGRLFYGFAQSSFARFS